MKTPSLRQIDAGPAALRGQVGVNLIDKLAVESPFQHRSTILPREADHGNAHRGAIDHPGLVAQASKIGRPSIAVCRALRFAPPLIELVETRPARFALPAAR